MAELAANYRAMPISKVIGGYEKCVRTSTLQAGQESVDSCKHEPPSRDIKLSTATHLPSTPHSSEPNAHQKTLPFSKPLTLVLVKLTTSLLPPIAE